MTYVYRSYSGCGVENTLQGARTGDRRPSRRLLKPSGQEAVVVWVSLAAVQLLKDV